ncbi:SGNH hydrolase domain-containing protein [Micromonospora sp. NBC_00898]|uniref:SGNH hydrolase domain-containing protein n=1 Tax=Micromonospora sp. NBC_00898 TaxID=2975981 RepID=UPI00386558C4|nr:SGNH hydrolase domain-containing protein [Micromonospora sp. NBC_00898]
MPPGAALVRRSALLLGTIVALCAFAVPAAAVPTYARNEPAVAVATPSTVYLEATYAGYIRDVTAGTLVSRERVVVTRRCSGVVVNPDGYVVTTTVCVQPSREVLLVNALYKLGRTLVQQKELTADQLDGFVAGRRDSSAFTGARRGTAPSRTLGAQLGVATGTAPPAQAIPGAVTEALPAVDGNVALVKLRRGGLPAIEIRDGVDLRRGTSLEILGYGLGEPAGPAATYTVRTRTVAVVGRTGTNRTGVDGQIGPASRGGPVVDAAGRLVAVLDTDTAATGEPIRDLITIANIRRLLDRGGVDNRLSEVDRGYRVALHAYFSGRYSQAVRRFDEVLSQDPTYAAAQTYHNRAQERFSRDGDTTENSGDWLLYLLSAAGGALIIAGAGLGQRLLGRRLRPAAVRAAGGAGLVGDDPKAHVGPAVEEGQPPAEPAPRAEPMPADLSVPADPFPAPDDPPAAAVPSPSPGDEVGPHPVGGPDGAERGDPAPEVRPPSGFRKDIEGLRALAVLLVVFWHADAPFISGGFVGVDVFFVISGYLITMGMAAEVAARGRLSLSRFWARRAKRLLPSSALVLVGALVLTYLFLPDIRWRDTAWDVVSSALYMINWRLAEQSVDYLAADQAPSIVQHYWSLAVEEQFYLVWPVLLVAVAWLARRRNAPPSRFGRLAVGAVGVVWVSSFAWSVVMVQTDPGRAYFVTTTRMWELAVGALLALWPFRRLTGAAASASGWLGIAAIAGSALALDTSTPFPGLLALPATVGTALVIAAGPAIWHGPVAVLRLGPLQFLGRISYTLYLWHWPLLVALTARLDDPGLAVRGVAVALAVLLAYLTSRFVERPVWHSRKLSVKPRTALTVGLACTVLSVCAGVAFHFAAVAPAPDGAAVGNAQGAAVLRPGVGEGAGVPVDHAPSVVPEPARARADLPSIYSDGCHGSQTDTTVRACTYGGPTATITVALIGDSHAAQWVPALQSVAEQRNWKLVTYTKSSCPVLDVEVAVGDDLRPYDSCVAWNRSLRSTLADDRPDLIVTSSYNYSAIRDGRALRGAENGTALVDSMRRTWQGLAEVAPVVVLRDTPAPRRDIAECVSAHREQLTRCAVPRDEALAGIGPLQADAAKGLSGVHLVDLNDEICPADRCAAVIGGVLVYRDTNHLTATYARSLAARLDEQLQVVMG